MIIMDRNENNYGPSPKCHDVMRNMTMEYFSAYSRDYPRRIKSRIAEQYGVNPDDVIVEYGAEDLLKQIIHWAVKPSSTIALTDMSWWYYKHIVAEVGAKMAEYHMKEEADSWDFDDEETYAILKTKPRLFIIASPSNPTGNFLSVDRMKKYLAAKDPSTLFVLDEAYWGFGAQAFPEKEVHEHKNFILLRTLSKYYALAGLRIGFAFLGKGLGDLCNLQEHLPRVQQDFGGDAVRGIRQGIGGLLQGKGHDDHRGRPAVLRGAPRDGVQAFPHLSKLHSLRAGAGRLRAPEREAPPPGLRHQVSLRASVRKLHPHVHWDPGAEPPPDRGHERPAAQQGVKCAGGPSGSGKCSETASIDGFPPEMPSGCRREIDSREGTGRVDAVWSHGFRRRHRLQGRDDQEVGRG